MFTENSLWKSIVENNYKGTSFVLDDGTTATITICYYGKNIPEKKDVEYFLVECPGIPWLSGENLEEIANKFNSIFDIRKEELEDKKNLLNFFNEHEKNGWTSEDRDFYSDWHKDIYGFRPRGKNPGEYVSPW